MVTVFFELNGQPRSIKVPDRAGGEAPAAPQGRAGQPGRCRRADAGRDLHGAVLAGQTVARGDVLLTIEAMKMETGVHAERDGMIAESSRVRGSRSTPRTCWWCWNRAVI